MPALIDTATGEFRLFQDAPPLRPEMSVAAFTKQYALRGAKVTPVFGRDSMSCCELFHTLVEIRFHLWIYFERDRLTGIKLKHIPLPPQPTSLIGRLIYRLETFLKGAPGPRMTEHESQEWNRECKRIHDEWIEAALGMTDPVRVWPKWGQIISREATGPMLPEILIEYYPRC